MYSGHGFNIAPKLERKYVEKNRRNQMQALFNQLYSLLPAQAFEETMALPDKIDAAVNYIKSLEMKLEKSKLHKEELRKSKKRPYLCMENHDPSSTSTKLSPQIEVHEMSPTMDIILMTGLDNVAMLFNIIRLLSEEGFEVMNASFSVHGNSMLQISHETKIMESPRMVYSRLKELLYGCSSSSDDVIESLLRLWDYEIESEMLWLI